MKIITTKSTDGIYYRGILSEADNPKGIIIHIHGMAGSPIQETYYETMHEEYPKAGWSFLATDNRGTGSITQFDNEKGETVNLGNAFEIFEDCIKDIQGFINFAKESGYKRIWLQAHSLGPSKTAYYMNQIKSIDVEGLIWISPSDMVGLVHDPIGIKDHEILLPESLRLVKENKPRQLLSNELWEGVMLSAQSYLSFFGENAKDAIFNYQNPGLGFEVVNSISIPVLAITGTKDDGIASMIDPYKGMEMLEKELKNSPRKKTVVYANGEHNFKGFEKNIVSDVLSFITI